VVLLKYTQKRIREEEDEGNTTKKVRMLDFIK
jgi:hypothetical protein